MTIVLRLIHAIAWSVSVLGVFVSQASAQVSGLVERTEKSFIVNGTIADIADFPWQVALVSSNRDSNGPPTSLHCGGALIRAHWVLTAAHCFYEEGRLVTNPAASTDVISGTSRWRVGGERTHLLEVFIHPEYGGTLHNDLALLHLAAPVQVAQFARLNTETTVTGDVTVAGWGARSFGGTASPVLRKVTMPILDKTQCDWGPNTLCVGTPFGRDGGACEGDSGGPMVSKGTEFVVGVVQGGVKCASYNVGARVSWFVPWINETITATLNRPAGYVPCRDENNKTPCNIDENRSERHRVRSIAFGTNGKYSYLTSADDLDCNTKTLADPLRYVLKTCLKSKLYEDCAAEYGTCTFEGTRIVAYGAGKQFIFKSATNSIDCTTAAFGADPAEKTEKRCYLVERGDVPDGFKKCASENNFIKCDPNGTTKLIAYGANGVYTFRVMSTSFECNNQTFGDPLFDAEKSCYIGDIQSCALENGTCTFAGLKTIAYGAQNKFIYSTLTGPVQCANATFTDPINGEPKQCYVIPDVPPNVLRSCAKRGETCKISGQQLVSYGAFGVYATKFYADEQDVKCADSEFGDPLIGEASKRCYVVAAPD